MGKCLYCEKTLLKRNKKYCSNTCQGQLSNKKVIDGWLAGGTAVKGVSLQIKRGIRHYLLKECDEKCEKCQWSGFHPADGRSLLHIHHRDGDASNSKRRNLQVLCPNCHSVTDNFGSRNRTSSRRGVANRR